MSDHVAVVGAGYAGVAATRRLERLLPEGTTIELIDDTGTHLVQHELHRTIRYPDLADAIEIPLDEIVDRATVTETRVEAVETDDRTIHTVDGTVTFDAAILATGAETADYGLPGVAEHGVPLKRLDHAARIREVATDADRIVVGGAGLSGVQVAGELAATEADIEVVVVERLDEVAPGFPRNFRRAVRTALDDRGIDVRTETAITGATPGTVETEAGPIPCDLFVWTGGITGTGATGGDRPQVRADLRIDDRTFGVGDAVRIVDAEGEAVPASAAVAIRAAPIAAKNVRRVLDGSDGFAPRLERYRLNVPGWIVSVGDGAVAQVGSPVLAGRAAIALKTAVGAGYLSSVGAVRNAVSLVNEELGLNVGADLEAAADEDLEIDTDRK
ncbi:NADH dehydrogenase FAD-containing subunit [Halobacteriales archaeon SW_7_68_16]|nr:MAG: NADH dehydrogenase FAD-containing subunit [Halobacteriales archaeon SW_7_68_16]